VTSDKHLSTCDKLAEDGWGAELDRWLAPFLLEFSHEAQQKWAPTYLRGLLGPGDRKSIEPMVARVCPGETQQLHHFVSTSTWDIAGHERVLLEKAAQLVSGSDAHLIIDDTGIPKKGKHSAGVAHQYCGQLGKNANCQVLVSVTLARHEVPVPVALRLYLPKDWSNDSQRRKEAKVPVDVLFRPKWQMALEEIDRIMRSNIFFGDVLADAGYGVCAEFRHELSRRNLKWAVGVQPDTLVFSASVQVAFPQKVYSKGRKPIIGTANEEPTKVVELFAACSERDFVDVTWRDGTKGPLTMAFAAIRVRPADGPRVMSHRHGPGDETWLLCEKRANGERKYHLSNYGADTDLQTLVSTIKARWACEQAHQQLKEELGLDHFEGRSWHGIHHHALLTMIAFAFLQHLRVRTNSRQHQPVCHKPDLKHLCGRTHASHRYPEACSTVERETVTCQKNDGARWPAA
jgi:SRSO17 transposase